MKLINYFLAISIIIFFTQCTGEESPVNQAATDLRTSIKSPVVEGGDFFDQIKWIEGHWVLFNGRDYERWTRTNYGYRILAYRMNGEDTIVIRRGTLKRAGSGAYHFMIQMLNINNGNPIIFTMDSLEPGALVFGNPDNAFPNKMKYFYQDEYTIKTYVEGVINEDPEVLEGIMKRRYPA